MDLESVTSEGVSDQELEDDFDISQGLPKGENLARVEVDQPES